jgi:hypothetical protein
MSVEKKFKKNDQISFDSNQNDNQNLGNKILNNNIFKGRACFRKINQALMKNKISQSSEKANDNSDKIKSKLSNKSNINLTINVNLNLKEAKVLLNKLLLVTFRVLNPVTKH